MNDNFEVNEDIDPTPMQEICDVAGELTELRIRKAFPGVSIYLPKKPDPDGEVVKTIGIEAATLLGEYFGGAWVQVPNGRAKIQFENAQAQKQTILRMSKEGATPRMIALECGCTERWVYYCLAQEREKERQRIAKRNQYDLFKSPCVGNNDQVA